MFSTDLSTYRLTTKCLGAAVFPAHARVFCQLISTWYENGSDDTSASPCCSREVHFKIKASVSVVIALAILL